MTVYTYADAQKNFAILFETAKKEGKTFVKTSDGTTFAITPEVIKRSPFDIPGVDTDITTEEILMFLHESRSAERAKSACNADVQEASPIQGT